MLHRLHSQRSSRAPGATYSTFNPSHQSHSAPSSPTRESMPYSHVSSRRTSLTPSSPSSLRSQGRFSPTPANVRRPRNSSFLAVYDWMRSVNSSKSSNNGLGNPMSTEYSRSTKKQSPPISYPILVQQPSVANSMEENRSPFCTTTTLSVSRQQCEAQPTRCEYYSHCTPNSSTAMPHHDEDDDEQDDEAEETSIDIVLSALQACSFPVPPRRASMYEEEELSSNLYHYSSSSFGSHGSLSRYAPFVSSDELPESESSLGSTLIPRKDSTETSPTSDCAAGLSMAAYHEFMADFACRSHWSDDSDDETEDADDDDDEGFNSGEDNDECADTFCSNEAGSSTTGGVRQSQLRRAMTNRRTSWSSIFRSPSRLK